MTGGFESAHLYFVQLPGTSAILCPSVHSFVIDIAVHSSLSTGTTRLIVSRTTFAPPQRVHPPFLPQAVSSSAFDTATRILPGSINLIKNLKIHLSHLLSFSRPLFSSPTSKPIPYFLFLFYMTPFPLFAS